MHEFIARRERERERNSEKKRKIKDTDPLIHRSLDVSWRECWERFISREIEARYRVDIQFPRISPLIFAGRAISRDTDIF